MKEIPSKYKCVRCKKDLRKSSDNKGCDCNPFHSLPINKSGKGIYKVLIDYNGKQRFNI